MDLFYREVGEGNTPLIILHGLFGSCDNWLTIAKSFPDQYKLYLVDARNHGRSPHIDEHNYDVLAEDLYQFIQEKNLENPVILGHSMGGKTVMNFAYKYPNIAQKIIVVDISPRYYTPHHQTIISAFLSVPIETMRLRGEAEEAMRGYIYNHGVLQFLLKNLYRSDNGGFAWRCNLQGLIKEIDNIGEALPADASIDTPTLFIRGSESDYIEDHDIDLIQKNFNDVSIETVDGAGHWVQAEKPQEFLAKLLPFLI